ncbi:hypothetical protein CKO31_05805 [Thiohalocapsa halophila]|uniref:Uracil-DNA glycosylase-like domain-containing protein n=1 Tax=Thiohalocapsa halophila TaxID=69359 RepID=A0ABS1CEV9_9GAMM|nr:uracil-DNA glycosylase family protein [Thiohalocapsa halophila]MBK1630268.1 hypothetical protein [Thiohalocapsa halophila]
MPAYALPSPGSTTREEITNCAPWWRRELQLVRPRLVIPVGRLAIARFLTVPRLDAVVGQRLQITEEGFAADVIALPHPSGASTWLKTEPGRTLPARALALIHEHPAWRALRAIPFCYPSLRRQS